MTPTTRFHIDRSGRWSGGGTGVLSNLAFAASRSSTLSEEPAPGTIPLIPRNVPTSLRVLRRPFVWMPQNALPWGPVSPAERSLQRRLRAASGLVSSRATAMVRISGALPPLRRERPTSEVLHNVLDEGFESALPVRTEESGAFVCTGSAHGYRRLPEVVVGHARYRATGGRTPLILQSSPGTPEVEHALRELAAVSSGVDVRTGGVTRAEALSLMAGSAGVLLPSDVEASPMTLLEARALGRPVACSDIRAHDELLDGSSPRFTSTDPDSVAAALHLLDDQGPSHPHPLQDPAVRVQERHRWADRLLGFLDGIA